MIKKHWLHIIAVFFLSLLLVRAVFPLVQEQSKQEPTSSWTADWDLEQEQKNSRGAEVSFAEEVMDKPAYLFYLLPTPARTISLANEMHLLADVFLETQTPPPNIA
ncbi:MAG: hypothetical protein QM781_14635 [Chitinophagaceae bacterium]